MEPSPEPQPTGRGPADAAGVARSSGFHAALVAAGILLSRLVGLVRQRVFAYYFSTSAEADAYSFAFRMPNFLQNLFGEGVLSASFIPVYASLVARGDREEARRVAGGIFAVLALAMAVLVLAGELLAPLLVRVLAPGFQGATYELAVTLVRIFFPGSGVLVLSAWCLGILNSHHRFFLSYAAPVVWNAAIIGALLWFGPRADLPRLARLTAWGAVVGAVLQFAVQLPTVLSLVGAFRIGIRRAGASVREVLRNFVPAFMGRGVGQISAYVDAFIATMLVTGSVAALNYAQLLYMLPVSLFGMSISAAELPAMSSEIGEESEVAARLRARLQSALRRVAFFVVPSAVAFLAFGDLIAAVVYRGGEFGRAESVWVWGILAGPAVGLLAATLGRLYSSALYALRDTRTPLRYAVVRVALTTTLGFTLAFPVARALAVDPRWAVAGITAGSAIAGWVEFALLRRALGRRIGRTGLAAATLARLWGSAGLAAVLGWLLRAPLGSLHPVLGAAVILAIYGVAYLALTTVAGVQEPRALVDRVLRRRRGAPDGRG